jgi:DNA repair protein RadA/Sms
VSEDGPAPAREPARPIAEIDVESARANPTGVGEFDRVLGGGLVPGAVILLAGEPGVGKSTLLLAVASNVADGALGPHGFESPRTVLYVTGEESAGQVRLRAERIGALSPTLLLAAETDLGTVLGHLEANQPDMLIVDSVQTVASAQVDGAPGGVSQVREVAAALIAVAKERQIPTILVGHVTKDGSVAGPRTLEHLVDVVCQFEGDRHSRLRMIRAVKNRYGPTDEVGCFDLSESGIVGLPDPSGLFLSHAGSGVAGSCITVTLEGRRPLAVEVQGLVAPSPLNNPRRATSGVDSSRLAMILAVLQRHGGLRLADQDVYASTVGGARITEPASDLAAARSPAWTAGWARPRDWASPTPSCRTGPASRHPRGSSSWRPRTSATPWSGRSRRVAELNRGRTTNDRFMKPTAGHPACSVGFLRGHDLLAP